MLENTIQYTVVRVEKETHDVFRLGLAPEGGLLSYVAGQVITIYYPEVSKNKGKEYSISSAPSENCFEITVKRVGVFSEMITSKKPGDIIIGSLPYGYFYTESEVSDLVFLAGGIGVVPFMSIIVETFKLNPTRKISLFYSNKNLKDIVFKSKLDNLVKLHKSNFHVFYYLTKEVSCEADTKSGRISVQDVLQYCNNETELFLCGSSGFVSSYYRALVQNNTSEQNIFTEEFS